MDRITPNDSNHQFSNKVYFNFLLCRLERIPLNKFNCQNEFNVNYDVGIKTIFI